jgi:hypothetical protein
VHAGAVRTGERLAADLDDDAPVAGLPHVRAPCGRAPPVSLKLADDSSNRHPTLTFYSLGMILSENRYPHFSGIMP